MEKENLILKISNLEKKIKSLEDKDDDKFDNNSFIGLMFDVFNFKRFLEIILRSQKRYTITEPQIHLILLYIFFRFIFWQMGILDLSSAITTLRLILVGICFEFLGANTSIFKSIFKKQCFLESISSMSKKQISTLMNTKNFSPNCMDSFIISLKNKDEYSPDIVYLIIDRQKLIPQNLDLLFSNDIIENLQADLIIRVLFKNRNSLKVKHIKNIYECCNKNASLVKILFATQKYSDSLLKYYPDEKDLLEYYEKYQIKKTHIDWKLNFIRADDFEALNSILVIVVAFVSVIDLMVVVLKIYPLYPLYPFMIIALFPPLFGALISFNNPFALLYENYYKRYINNVVVIKKNS